MDAETSPQASIIGCGIALTDEGTVGVVLMLADMTDDGERTLGTIMLDMEMTQQISDKIQALLAEGKMAQDAVREMGTESAREYLNNWAKRINSQLN